MVKLTRELSAAIAAAALETFPYVRLRVTGGCMEPALLDGQSVMIVRHGLQPPRWGDVVLVRHRQGLRLHRLVWRWPFTRDARAWLTKGDRSRLCDPPLAPRDVLGIVLETGRGGRVRAAMSLVRGLLAWPAARLGWKSA